MGASRHYIYHVELGQRDPTVEFMTRWVETLGGDATMDLFGPWRLKMQPHAVWPADEDAA